MSDYSPDFVERNGAWLLSISGVTCTMLTLCFGYFLKSRCSRIKCCGLECERDTLTGVEIERLGRISDDARPISVPASIVSIT